MKKAIRLLLSALLVFLLVVGIAACGKKDPPSDGTDSGTGSSQITPGESGNTPMVITVEQLANTKIVYAERASDAIIKSAETLKDTIKRVFDVEVALSSDYLREGSDIFREYDYEILIGETAREDDDAFYASLRYEDYGYQASPSGKKILIGGNYDSNTVDAVSAFSFDVVLKKAGGEGIFYRSELIFAKNATYTVDHLTLNGTSITDYTIVYPKGSSAFEEKLAMQLSSRILRQTGYRIPYVSDKQAYSGGHEILIGKTNRADAVSLMESDPEAMHGCLAGNDRFVVAYGSDIEGNACAVSKLVSMIDVPAADKSLVVTVEGTQAVAPSESVSAMTFNVYVGDRGAIRESRVLEMITRYMPDLVGLQETDPAWIEKLNKNFSAYYTIVGEYRNGDGKGEASAIMFNKHRFELLETGTKWLSDTPDVPGSKLPGAEYIRVFTWALLKDRVTGETMLHINTHFDFASDVQIRELQIIFDFLHNGYEEYPLMLTGDMNAHYTSAVIQTMVKSGLVNSNQMVAPDTLNTAPSIDWLMLTPDCISVSSVRICNETINGGLPSDHAPVYTEFTVKVPEGGVKHDFEEPLPVFDEKYLQPKKDTEGEDYGIIHRVF